MHPPTPHPGPPGGRRDSLPADFSDAAAATRRANSGGCCRVRQGPRAARTVYPSSDIDLAARAPSQQSWWRSMASVANGLPVSHSLAAYMTESRFPSPSCGRARVLPASTRRSNYPAYLARIDRLRRIGTLHWQEFAGGWCNPDALASGSRTPAGACEPWSAGTATTPP